MSKAINEHLKNITEDNLINFRDDAYCEFASCSGKKGSFGIGVNGLGNFVVRTSNNAKVTFGDPAQAISLYKSCVE